MSELIAPTHNPWRSLQRHEPALAHVYRELWARRGQLQQYEGVMTGVRFLTAEFQPAECSIGALLRLWERWPAFQGDCPVCSGRILGAGCLGQLADGLVLGVCLKCALVAGHHLPGQNAIRQEVINAMRPSQHRIPEVTGQVNYQPLIAVLQEQGAEGLPQMNSVQSIFTPWEVAPVADAPTSSESTSSARHIPGSGSSPKQPAEEISGWMWVRVAVITAVLLRAWSEAQLA